MAEFQKINLGAAANDKTGTPARQAGNIINNNFGIVAAEIFQDKILKYGPIALSGLNVSIAANAFAWRINQVEFLTPLAFSQAITVASDGKYRTDSIVGTDTGAYLYVPGTESTTQTGPPTIPANTIRVGNVNIFGSIISEPVVIVPTPAKTIPLVGNDKIVINDSQDSEKTKTRTWQEVSSQITEGIFIPDTVIRTTEPTRVGNEFTFPVDGYEVLLNKTRRSNTNELKVTPVAATTDYKRVDVVYFKPDNTLDSIQGDESLTVAVRPEVPVGSIAIYFINVFGATIEAPTPIDTEISVQDVFGTSIFNIKDYVRFEGVSFNPTQKLISINPLVPLSAFLDIVTGSDVTGTLENSRKPFKTITALFNALPPTTGETYTIYITGGTVPVLRQIKLRNLRFVAYAPTTLDFTNCKDSDGITESEYCLLSGYINSTFTFENENISIISDYVGKKQMVTSSEIEGATYKGALNVLNFKSTATVQFGSSVGFFLNNGTDLKIKEVHDSLQTRATFRVGTGNLRILKYITQRKNTITRTSGYASSIDLQIDSIVEGSVSGMSLDIQANNLILGNVTINGKVKPRAKSTLFQGVISSGCTVSLEDCSVLKGSLISTTYCDNEFINNKVQVFENFTGKLSNLAIAGVGGGVLFINSSIETTSNLMKKNNNANTYYDLIEIRGACSIISNTPDVSLVGPTFVAPASDIRANINIKGTLKTNMPSFGANITSNYITTTFKEKLNEVTVRSKKDLVNRVLSSNITYVIDGLITLVAGEFILIPIGGLTFGGYGFDVSQIIKNVSGEATFKSPVGGSGNFVSNLVRYNSGLGSVFDIVDADGSHAIEVNDINFQDCSSLGKIKGYRQVTGHTIGMYNCSDGLIVSGTWNGFVISKLHVRNFASTGTLFKKDTDTTFSNRFSLGVNISGNSGFKIADFDNTNFTKDETFQLDDCTIEVDGVISAANTPSLIPNISPNDPKCRWVNSTGIQLSAVKFQDLKSPDGSIWRLTVNDLGAPTWTELT